MESRQEIKTFINSLEREFPVSLWQIDGVHLWPFIRVKLFTALIAQIESSHNEQRVKAAPIHQETKTGFIQSKVNRVKNSAKYLRMTANRKLNRLSAQECLVATSATHRTNFNEKSFNKFADPLLDEFGNGLNLETSALHLYDQEKINQSKRVVYFYDYFNAVLKSEKRKERLSKAKEVQLDDYEDFENKVSDALNQEISGSGLSKPELIKIMDRFHDFAETYELILEQTKPRVVFSVCHYTFTIMVLNYVANKKRIKTVEIQHGPQSDEHMGYASWNVLPAEGFNTLPKYFWNWDKYSFRVVNDWISHQDHHQNFIGGNPWVQYFVQENEEREIVLYSLQNLTFDHLFPAHLVEAIKNSKWKWWIRLHPRQLEYLEDVMDFFEKNEIIEKVNVIEATNDPLPKILSRTRVHITNFSGCTLEASSFGIPSMLIDDRGKNAFQDLIDEGRAIYCDDPLLFEEELGKLENTELSAEQKVYDWKALITNLSD